MTTIYNTTDLWIICKINEKNCSIYKDLVFRDVITCTKCYDILELSDEYDIITMKEYIDKILINN